MPEVLHHPGDAAPSSHLPWWRSDATLHCPARRDDLRVQQLDDEALFSDPQTGTTYRLNATALDFWQRLNPARSTRQIAAELAEDYAIEVEQALADLEQAIAFFGAHNLLRP